MVKRHSGALLKIVHMLFQSFIYRAYACRVHVGLSALISSQEDLCPDYTLNNGVPQGSDLGSLIFCFYYITKSLSHLISSLGYTSNICIYMASYYLSMFAIYTPIIYIGLLIGNISSIIHKFVCSSSRIISFCQCNCPAIKQPGAPWSHSLLPTNDAVTDLPSLHL